MLVCYEATIKGQDKPIVIEDLEGTEYEETDPNVKKYGLRSYLGYPVLLGSKAIGSLCIVDLEPRKFTMNEVDIISTLAKAVSLEEERMRAEEELAKYRYHLEDMVEERAAELRRANEELQQEISERKRTEEALKKSRQQLRNLAAHLQSVREEERRLIAREIHDDLGQALTALKMDIRWLADRLPDDQALLLEKAKSMSGLVDNTVHSVQKICSGLRPGLLDDLGIAAAIEWQAKEFENRTSIRCDARSDPEDIILDQDRSTTIFRIFQETLTNIARHAGATRVEARLKKKFGELELMVSDNGKGIVEKQISDPESFGLTGMRERVYLWGGEVSISGIANKGTTVRVSIPLDNEGEDP